MFENEMDEYAYDKDVLVSRAHLTPELVEDGGD